MSKGQSIVDVLSAVVSAFAEFRIRAPVEWSDEERAAYQAAYDLCCSMQSEPSPAPQSEPEAVRLLRALFDATQSKTLHMATMVRQEADSLYALTCEVETFLSRPPGPDWRMLATNAFHAWKLSTGDSSTIYCMHEIGDAIKSEAAAAGKGAT